MTFRNIETGEELTYRPHPNPNSGLSICPHGNEVAYSDECDACMREYE